MNTIKSAEEIKNVVANRYNKKSNVPYLNWHEMEVILGEGSYNDRRNLFSRFDEAMEEYASQFKSKELGNVWVKAKERLPNEKGYYISRRPTLSGTSWIVENKPFNPKYDDTYLHNWKNYEIEWLDENTQVESDIDVAAENHSKLGYAKAPEQTIEDAEYIQAVSFNSFKAGAEWQKKQESNSLDAINFMKFAFENYHWTGDTWDENTGHDDFESYTIEELYNIYLEQQKSNK